MKKTIKLLVIALVLTSIASCSGGLKSQDDNNYKTIKIGNQVWMTQNLNESIFRNGDSIPEAKTKEEWVKAGEDKKPAWCYYNNDPANGIKYGKLYNWYVLKDNRNIAPTGWHVPSDAEWTTLITYLGGENIAGGKLKSTSSWTNRNTSVTNSSGFTAFPAGCRYTNGNFGNDGNCCIWWSSTGSTGNAWDREIYNNGSSVIRNKYMEGTGFSVRCIITSSENEKENSDDHIVNPSTDNYEEFVGNYGFEKQGQVQLKIIKENNSFYLQFPNSISKELMSKVSDSDCSRILGTNWQNILVSALHSGAFFIFKVKTGSVVEGVTINSGFFGAIPGSGQIWKIN